MNIKVVRPAESNGLTTIGKMYIDNVFFANTLEDKIRNQNGNCSLKVQNQTCIDFGTYTVVLSMSNHFGKVMPEILNVKCFAGIRIHGGNFPKDTEGCILIGAQTDEISKIWDCSGVVEVLIDKLQAAQNVGEKVTIEITK